MFRILVPAIAIALLTPAYADDSLTAFFAERAVPLEDAASLDPLLEGVGDRRLVLLGEASHGTEEFYTWRTEISKRLIEEKDFSFIAVEGDWAAIYRLNKFVKHLPGAPASAREALLAFDRWPEWMWGNTAILELTEWLHAHNADLPADQRIGFYGMDVYGQWQALDDLLAFAESNLDEHHEAIAGHLACFDDYNRDQRQYSQAVAQGLPTCQDAVEAVVALLREETGTLKEDDPKAYFRAKQNALVVQHAEAHFRLAAQPGGASWNARATHMWITVQRLLDHHGDDSKGIVWAHNTHVGDARATPMGMQQMVNIGHLSRENLGARQVFITGFGTYSGEVNAGMHWESPMQVMDTPEAQPGSLEAILAAVPHETFYIPIDDEVRAHPPLAEHRGHRAIGVVFDPRGEARNYVPTIFPQRYDGFIFIRHTGALTPVE